MKTAIRCLLSVGALTLSLGGCVTMNGDEDGGLENDGPEEALGTQSEALTGQLYWVKMTFDFVRFYNISDGAFGHPTLEVYGTLGSSVYGGTNSGAGSVRNFGAFGNPDGCDAVSWSADYGYRCPKHVDHYPEFPLGGEYDFAYVALCTTHTYSTCDTPYSKHNNEVWLQVAPGQKVRATAHIKDYDWGSADDDVCKLDMFSPVLTEAMLQGYWNTLWGTSAFSDGSCAVGVTYETMGPVY